LFCRYNTRFRPARLCSTGIFSWDFFQPKLEFSVPDEPIAAEKSSVTIYTDGAAEPNPGPGGYGIVLMAGKHRKELSGGFRLTTNNRMELMGVIVALEALSKPCLVKW
jgi:ribonuclease HI